jgi:hypothetical protein
VIATLTWEEPPPARRKGVLGQVDRVVEELQKKPGQWARVEDEATAAGAAKKWEDSGCEVTVRTIEVEAVKDDGSTKPKKRYRLWARWPEAPAAERARTATAQEAAEAYARQHGYSPKPAPQEPTPGSVKEQLARRLGHKGAQR